MNCAAGAAFFLTFMFHILPVHIHSAPLQETLIRSAPLLKGTTELLVKRKKSISYSISPALNLRARKRIKPEALRLTQKKKSSLFFLAHRSASVTGTDTLAGGLVSPSVLPILPRHSLPTSGGILVQVGLSLYIPAPSCHAGDYDAEGRSGWWWWWCWWCMHPFAGAL